MYIYIYMFLVLKVVCVWLGKMWRGKGVGGRRVQTIKVGQDRSRWVKKHSNQSFKRMLISIGVDARVAVVLKQRDNCIQECRMDMWVCGWGGGIEAKG